MAKSGFRNIKKVIFGLLLVAIAVGVTLGVANINSSSNKAQTTVNSQQQITEISYQGQNGVDALTLLKKHAIVATKHYSFGDLVTSINDASGTGPKYWTFYINGQEASVGAGAYITKSTDNIDWKLQ